MLQQTNGRVVIGGSFKNVNGVLSPYIARLNTDGSLDGTFNPGAGPNSTVYSLALQSDGKILEEVTSPISTESRGEE